MQRLLNRALIRNRNVAQIIRDRRKIIRKKLNSNKITFALKLKSIQYIHTIIAVKFTGKFEVKQNLSQNNMGFEIVLRD